MTLEAMFVKNSDVIDETATAATVGGEVLQLASGLAAVRTGLKAAATGDAIGCQVEGIFDFASASATTITKGNPVYWNATTNLAVAGASTLSGVCFYIGLAIKAKIATELTVRVDLNAAIPGTWPAPWPAIYEFDCETGVDAAVHTFIPAAQNLRGLIVLGVYGIVTEVFAGTEDQGIVTIKDTATSPATLATLTAANATADALNDVLAGTTNLLGAASGSAVTVVAAGLGITGQVTQATTGSATGKMKVFVLVYPLS